MTDLTFSIRVATKNDAKLLPNIERSAGAAFRSIPDLAWIASDEVQSEAQHLALIENGAAWVAVNERDEPVGFLNGERRSDAFHILEISVRSELQGRGLGRLLIEEAAAWASAAGLSELTLTTFRNVPWNAPFYERLGFRVLEPAEQSDELRQILEIEAENGLHGRCAMVRQLNNAAAV